jgi:glycerol-3-phosphate acyltransferase PlsY
LRICKKTVIEDSVRTLLIILLAYLLGSIPFGYLIVRATQGADIRETGSGGTGATNVSRRAGKAAGVLTLILDALKGAAAVAIARLILGLTIFGAVQRARPHAPMLGGGNFGEHSLIEYASWFVAAAAVAVIVGHIFPVWLRFRGGKGVATGVGVFLVLAPIAVAFAAVIFVLVVWQTRYVSLGSILAAVSIPVFVLLHGALSQTTTLDAPVTSAAIVSAILIIFAHRGNIGRLIMRTESKFE